MVVGSIAVSRQSSFLSCFCLLAVILLASGCSDDGTAPGDVQPPGSISDLSVASWSTTSVKLSWTAPGDDGMSGTASRYEVRYFTNLINASNWDSASTCDGEPVPGASGTTETYTVSGLLRNLTYYFAVKSADEVPNWSGLSNSASRKTANGSIVTWGDNTYGQCDAPSLLNASYIAVASGSAHSLGLKSDGTIGFIVTWGNNSYGQCNIPSPNNDFVAMAGGDVHSLGLKSGGTIVAWGSNNIGQCNVPAPNADFIGVAAGKVHGLGLKSDGKIIAWGSNLYGQCSVPESNTDFIAIAGGQWHSMGIK